MTITFAALEKSQRLLMEAKLSPIQGTRFQPTGFPDLGAALYEGPDGSPMLLVESAQSMANRLEAVCWDHKENNWIEPLKELPFIKVFDKEKKYITNSVLEAHRINSEYIARTDDFQKIASELEYKKDKPFDIIKKLVPFLMKYDVNSLLNAVDLRDGLI